MKKTFFLPAILLFGCISPALRSTPVDTVTLGDQNYTIQIPYVPYIKKIEDGDVAATSMPDDMLEAKDWRIELYEAPSCPPLGIGTPQHMSVGGDEALWGRVDAWRNMDAGGFELPAAVWQSPCANLENAPVYGFCAEKNTKAVAICIRQQTDNPKLAEDIFKTFRWTN